MKDPVEQSTASGFKDRRKGLVVFGVLSIVIGALCGCLALVLPIVLVAASHTQPDLAPPVTLRTLVPNLFLYLGLAAGFVWTGMGSIQARRWVRPIMLTLAWTWLFCGVLGLVLWILMLSDFGAALASISSGESETPRGLVAFAALIATAVLVVIYVALPACFVAFYQSRHVRATLEHYDPTPSWTDRCPLPVLGLSLGLGFGAPSVLLLLAYGFVPAFGAVFTGAPAVLLVLVFSAVLLALARSTYRLKPAGWWGTLAVSILVPLSGTLTLLRVRPAEIYSRMGMGAEQIEMLSRYRALDTPVLIAATWLVAAASVGYMIYVRKYFEG